MLPGLVQVCCQPGKRRDKNGGEGRDEEERGEGREGEKGGTKGKGGLVAATGHVCNVDLTYLCEWQSTKS